MKETFYFSHDYNARSDVKIKKLLAKHGMSGYGIYWSVVEDLYQNANALPTDYEGMAYDLRTDEKTIKSIINDFDLFVIEDEQFGSLSVQRRIDERDAKSTKARESAFKRWNKKQTQSERNANALQTQSEGNAIKESKGKEKKVKPKDKSFVPPTLFEVVEYFKENNYNTKIAEKAFKYYNDANWKDSKGSQVKNWKQKMQGVWFKDENKLPDKTGIAKWKGRDEVDITDDFYWDKIDPQPDCDKMSDQYSLWHWTWKVSERRHYENNN